jgi:hypothetical protein
MLGAGWTQVVALSAAFVIAVLATPAGVSGAVLLLPFQVSVLGTPSPAVTPTNLLYNVVATPGALYRYWRQGQTGGRLAVVLVAGTLPGVIAGSVIRVELLPAGSGQFPNHYGGRADLDQESRPNPARATERAATAAMASTTIPATFQASVAYSRANPRRSRAGRAGLSARVISAACQATVNISN